MVTEIVVFISSPDEVKPERQAALKIIRNMKDEARSRGMSLQGYDQKFVPPKAVKDPRKGAQDVIIQDDRFSTCHLLVVLFWRRLGSPTPREKSGTVEEFKEALKRSEKTGSPEVFVYFKDIDPFCLKQPCSQIKALQKFRRDEAEKVVFGAAFESVKDFEEKFENDLRDFLTRQERLRKPNIPPREWHLLSGSPENVTDKGTTYSPVPVHITYEDMERLAKEDEQLRKDKGLPSRSSFFANLYRLYKRSGDWETANSYMQMAHAERAKALVDLLDKRGNRTGRSCSQAEAHKKRYLHATCHTFVLLNRRRIYVQKRTTKKHISPRKWTSSSCGHVRKGETPKEAAQREIQEELGLPLSTPLTPLGKANVKTKGPQNTCCNAIAYVFATILDERLDESYINRDEISELKLFSPLGLKRVLSKKNWRSKFAADLKPVFSLFFEWFSSSSSTSD